MHDMNKFSPNTDAVGALICSALWDVAPWKMKQKVSMQFSSESIKNAYCPAEVHCFAWTNQLITCLFLSHFFLCLKTVSVHKTASIYRDFDAIVLYGVICLFSWWYECVQWALNNLKHFRYPIELYGIAVFFCERAVHHSFPSIGRDPID